MRFPTIYFRFTGIRWPTSTRPGKLAQEARPPHRSAGELFCLIGFSRPVARAVGCVPAMEACAARWLFRETLVAHLYGLRTVGRQGVSPGGGEAILGCGLSYLLALHRVRLLAVLSERVICREQNEASYKYVSRHGGSGAGLWALPR
jgi:hypothetical protein